MRERMIVCRCEDVTLAQLEAALADGAASPAEVKHRTRAAMGACAGRTCRPLLERLLAERPPGTAFSERLPARPLTVGELAATPLAGERDDGALPSTRERRAS
ncbi:(2Fe-2S)-binding protein [Conexibacter arvalis]|uniref:Bacterioferritin-associated ferredoxin n=1 Tax=Conexibacter arvalis TaxID=912552 RepID=A0A840I6Q9_9ACTN|nr:(2Fe-2S)-binding protein [Conexibacter arvalis]MBB4660579.1 bacterioferritin-associated ferredoxin [Conexibacter arvalis]